MPSYLPFLTMNTTPGDISESSTKPSVGFIMSSCPSRRGAYMFMKPSHEADMPSLSASRMPTVPYSRLAACSENSPSPYTMSLMCVSWLKLSSTPFTVTMACLPSYTARAWSSTHSVATSTSGRVRIRCSTGSSAGAVFPCAGTTSICGSNAVRNDATKSWNPLNTLSVTTSAIVATATPTALMPLIRLITCVLFFEKRYRRAM